MMTMTPRFRVWLLLAVVTAGVRVEAARGFLSKDAAEHGRKLADVYCGTCHVTPSPGIIDRNTWEMHTLPWMAAFLGVYDGFYKSNKLNAARAAGAAWTKAPLHPNDFNAIASYYQLSAPTRLYSTNQAPVIYPTTSGFRLRQRAITEGLVPSATMVHISARDGRRFVGQETPPKLYLQRDAPETNLVIQTGAIPVSMFETDDGIYFMDIGNMTPDHGPIGKVYFVPRAGDGFGPGRVLLDELPRSGQISPADLNDDGRMDIIVCSFGFFGGELAWYEGLVEGGFRRHLLLNRAGAVKAEARDLNGDGFIDIAVLMAQGLESMFYLYNDGRGGFEPERMFHQHPAFGYCDFELVDFDRDGKAEVVTANGDFDYEGGPRPYHGIRIYRGEAPMKEVYHFQMPGGYHVEAADFDGDGDQDLVAVSFTPGLGVIRTPRSVFLENQGGFRFRPWELPHGNDGRWFIMHAGDADGDGDKDLLIGALYNAPGGMAPSNQDISVAFGAQPFETLLLENVFRDPRATRLDRQRRESAAANSAYAYSWLPQR